MSNGTRRAENTLLAVYDFASSRISFDFFSFLVLAEVERRKLDLDSIRLVVVPADGDGFHPNVQYDLKQKQWRLRNVILSGVTLLPSCVGITMCHSRALAEELLSRWQGDVFPSGYEVFQPVVRWQMGWIVLAAHLGENLQVFRASAQARAYAQQWLSGRADGRRSVVLTLREASHNAQRNTELKEWAACARQLAADGFHPVIVRDIETALEPIPEEFDGIDLMSEAAFNLDLRFALYELAYFNLVPSNGPPTLGWFDRNVKFAYFATGDWLYDDPPPMEGMGIARGEKLPFHNRFQRMYWCDSDTNVLVSAARELAADIEATAPGPEMEEALNPVSSCRLPLDKLAARFLRADEWELAVAACAAGSDRGDSSPDLQRIGRLAAERLRSSRDATHGDAADFQRARKLAESGSFEQAEKLLRNLMDRLPAACEPYVDLGLILEAQQKYQEAAEVYGLAVQRGVAAPETVFRLGRVMEALGQMENALDCYEHLVDVGSKSPAVHAALAAARQAVAG